MSVALTISIPDEEGVVMQKTTFVNPFVVLKLEKQVKIAKGKQAISRHFEQLRHEKRKLQNNVQIVTTIYYYSSNLSTATLIFFKP